jgi:deazaflavin-dependent oxidoreductase (nitroreductase family)
MGLREELGYDTRSPNVLQRTVQRVAASRPGAYLFSKTARYVDRLALRVTGGRSTAAELMGGFAVLTLTTTGAKSGQPRTSALLGVPSDDGNLALVGTNFGQRATPAWFHNLRAHPEASVEYRKTVVPVRSREAEGEERERIVEAAEKLYVGFAAYQRRIDHRPIHVMVLEPR